MRPTSMKNESSRGPTNTFVPLPSDRTAEFATAL